MLITYTVQVSHHGEGVARLGLVHKRNPPVNSSFGQPVTFMPALPAKQGALQTKPVATVMKPELTTGQKSVHVPPRHDVSGASASQELSGPCFLSQGWCLPRRLARAGGRQPSPDPEVTKRPGAAWACLEEASTCLGVLTASGGVCACMCCPRGWKGVCGPRESTVTQGQVRSPCWRSAPGSKTNPKEK